MKVETIDPWAFVRDNDKAFVNSSRTRATISMPPSTAVGVGWSLFWRSLWAVIRRERGIDFWIEG